MSEVVVQIIGFVAMAIGISSVQWPRRRQILALQLLSNLLWVVHFGILGAISGAVMNVAGAFRTAMFYYFDGKRRKPWVLWLVIVVVVLAGAVTWQGWLSALPVTAVVIAAVALWQTDEQRIRSYLILSAPLWLTYNVLSGSIAGAINEVVLLASLSLALWRYRKVADSGKGIDS